MYLNCTLNCNIILLAQVELIRTQLRGFVYVNSSIMCGLLPSKESTVEMKRWKILE